MTWICKEFQKDWTILSSHDVLNTSSRLYPKPVKINGRFSINSNRLWFEPFQFWNPESMELKADENHS